MLRALGFRMIAALAVLVVGTVGGFVSRMGTTEVEATVTRIDRTCTFVEQGTKRQFDDDCNSSDEWDEVRANKAKQNIVGHADITVTYAAPGDGAWQSGTIRLTPSDPMFFSIRADDQIRIRVDDEDPGKIHKA